jgi:5-methylthioribose kinase
MSLREKFNELYPKVLFLEHQLSPELTAYLRQKAWIHGGEMIEMIEKPGEGNMNFVMRVKTNRQSFIVKQARPWVEKYPQVAAPIERIMVEARFYQAIQNEPILKSFTPQLIGYDASHFTMALEDLGAGADYMEVYQKNKFLTDADMQSLMSFVSRLHHMPKPDFPLVSSLKKLNHEHIFNYPFVENNGFDLDTVQVGLQALARPYQQDNALKKRIKASGKIYLKPEGKTLIHGDFYPGSWLKVATGTKIIDPEFGFIGRPEFDLGVLIAHLKMSEHSSTFIDKALTLYQKPPRFNVKMMWAFAGVEVLRRILGLAQLPLALDLEEKGKLLHEAKTYI